jgi:hypothetical protein
LVPQIVGGADPPGFVTVNVSVRHWDTALTDFPPATVLSRLPFRVLPMLAVLDEGPEITNELKSRRS